MNELITRYPKLEVCFSDIEKAIDVIINTYKSDGKLLLCGNGGSSADCEHIVGELMKGFISKRPLSQKKKEEMKSNCNLLDDEIIGKLQCGLPAIALPSITGLNSAFCNDVDPELIYAQSLLSLAKDNDVLLCISTSGNAENCVAAAKVAKGIGVTVIGLTGESGGKLKDIADVCICAPEKETYKIQELHLPIYHHICMEIEKHFFVKENN